MFKSGPKADIKGVSKELTRVFFELDKTRRESAQEGYVPNLWGAYWATELIGEWLLLNERLGEVEDESEKVAAKYSRAGFLLGLNRLDESFALYEELARRRPNAAMFKGMAIVQARRGLLEEARRLAQMANTAPHGHAFKTTEDELREEAQIGARFSSSR